MSYAVKLISNSSHSITDICYESGFTSLSHFINEFKKSYPISPSEYRKKAKKSANESKSTLWQSPDIRNNPPEE